jgi:hypothetical protein
MQTTFFHTRNDQKVELFFEGRGESFELWVVAPRANQRTILNHYLTRDNIAARLRYTKSVLLAWAPAEPGDLPAAKSEIALKDEETMDSGTFWESEDLIDHLGAIAALDRDPAALDSARRMLAGEWSDGSSSVGFGPEGGFEGKIAPSAVQRFLRAAAKIQPDEWSFSENWQLRLLNRQSRKAERTIVHKVTHSELHLGGTGNCLAFVLKRQPGAAG